MILIINGQYSCLYSNKTDPRNKTGGVARPHLNKGIWRKNKTKKLAVKYEHMNNQNIFQRFVQKLVRSP
jgi:hypothetical protein